MIGMTRRDAISAALVTAAAIPLGLAPPAAAEAGPPRAKLPAPTGPHPIGTVALRLVDHARDNRELMISVWFPARDVARHPVAPWLPAAVLRELLVSAGFEPDVVASPLTAGHVGAQVRRVGGRLPVILFSHGAHDHRADTTIIVQELAGHGYAVVTIDHTDDAFSQFPDGRVIVPVEAPALGPQDFADDALFVLDRLSGLPGGLSRALDLRRIGMFGWSKGASATARVLLQDRRVRAGLSLDGPMEPAAAGELDRPFMLMTAEFPRDTDPNVAAFWDQLTGWRLTVQAAGAAHQSYVDYAVLLPQVGQQVGTLDPRRAVRIQQAYPLAFFDLHLRGRRSRLLDGPSRLFPEVAYLP